MLSTSKSRISVYFVVPIENIRFLHVWQSLKKNPDHCCIDEIATYPHAVTILLLSQYSWYNLLADAMHPHIFTEDGVSASNWNLNSPCILLNCLTMIRAQNLLHLPAIVIVPWCCKLFAVQVFMTFLGHVDTSETWTGMYFVCHECLRNLQCFYRHFSQLLAKFDVSLLLEVIHLFTSKLSTLCSVLWDLSCSLVK
jgi:hypothetical protein